MIAFYIGYSLIWLYPVFVQQVVNMAYQQHDDFFGELRIGTTVKINDVAFVQFLRYRVDAHKGSILSLKKEGFRLSALSERAFRDAIP